MLPNNCSHASNASQRTVTTAPDLTDNSIALSPRTEKTPESGWHPGSGNPTGGRLTVSPSNNAHFPTEVSIVGRTPPLPWPKGFGDYVTVLVTGGGEIPLLKPLTQRGTPITHCINLPEEARAQTVVETSEGHFYKHSHAKPNSPEPKNRTTEEPLKKIRDN